MNKDYYKILGIAETASPDEVKTAFRKLAHEYHPDKKGGNAEKFKEINEAYQVLSNSEKRARYDQFGSAAFDSSNSGSYEARAGGPFGGFDFSGFEGGVNVDFGDLGEALGGMFGLGGRGRGHQQTNVRGSDIEARLALTFEEAIFGVEKQAQIKRRVRCPHCAGGGVESGYKLAECANCKGKGSVRSETRTFFGVMASTQICAKCEGRGKIPEKPCHECRGSGAVISTAPLVIRIPAGVNQGGVMKIRGEGEAGNYGAPAGDLYLHLQVAAHPKFTREGEIIRSRESVGFSIAALGGVVRVATLKGEVELKIPAGTQAGTEFRLRGKGVRNSDQIITVGIKTPTKLSKEQRRLLEEWQRLEKNVGE